MKAGPDMKPEPGTAVPGFNTPEKQKGLFRLPGALVEMRLNTLLRLYRFASLFLAALLFLGGPSQVGLQDRLTLILLVLASALLLTLLYERFWENSELVAALVLMEVIGLSLLLSHTGGFNGPFLWYALNPFIVASAFISFRLAWLLLLSLFAGKFGVSLYLSAGSATGIELLSGSYYPVLNLVVIALIIHLYTRMHHTMSDRMVEGSIQREEMLSMQQNLTFNYQVFKALSGFQREAALHQTRKEIFSALVNTLMNLFPFRQAAVLIPPPDFKPGLYREDASPFQVIGSEVEKTASAAALIRRELEDRWKELELAESKKALISENRRWIALPLRGENKEITAVFVGWHKPRTNPLSFTENLALFIRFAEQTAAWLTMFKQKERVLQHISAVYEAVETVSSQNDPRVVIDLFASYARALTDCEKSIFWMVNAGDWENDAAQPIYSIKGRRDSFPEDEWRVPLLQAWSEMSASQEPIVMDLRPESEEKGLLISVPVTSGAQCLGMLSCIQSNHTFSTGELTQILNVLADLSAIAVVRTRAERFAEKLVVVEEQKRIASEIHDTISQNLFSIVYSIDALSKEAGRTLDRLQKETLHDIKNLSSETARELRALIYRLNPRKEANETFINEMNGYLDKMARMNDVHIEHSVSGSAEYLNPAICKNLYRIIKESTGNALRHGNCSIIKVHLDITPFRSLLKVKDNGAGFDVESSLDLYYGGNRLGLVNMRELALALQGTLHIDSAPGEGTEVTCTIPTTPVSVE